MKIFVARLNFKTTTSDLKAKFEEFGEVDSAKVVTDKDTNKSKGFGFVDMPNKSEALAAIAELHDSEFDGRTIVVQESEERGGNNGGGRGRERDHRRGR